MYSKIRNFTHFFMHYYVTLEVKKVMDILVYGVFFITIFLN